MPFINLIFGGSLLIWGRKLFWLFVAAAGFFSGWQIAQTITRNELVGIIVGIVFAVIGALLAMFLKSIAIAVAGFLMGGAILTSLAGFVGIDSFSWIVYIIGGIGGVILISMFFDWALIILSSLGGASLIVQAFSMDSGLVRFVLFAALLIFGMVYQSRQLAKEKNSQIHEPLFMK